MRDAIDALSMVMQLLAKDLSNTSRNSAGSVTPESNPIEQRFPSKKFKIMMIHAVSSLTQLKTLILELLRENLYSEFTYVSEYLTVQLWSLFDPEFRSSSRLSAAFLENPQVLASLSHADDSESKNVETVFSDQSKSIVESVIFKDLLDPFISAILLKELLNAMDTLSKINATIHIAELTIGLEVFVSILRQGDAL